ncbi:MAG TPA: hypothetical protein VF773_03075 [Verrucomicrobiae bacterium]
MSYKVLIIPEDFTKDEHVLKPLVEKVLADAGKSNTAVLVCRDPNFAGIGEALKLERLKKDVIQRYPMVDLFILFVDRDGLAARDGTVAGIEKALEPEFKNRKGRFVAEVAHQEVEVFVLAGHDLPTDWSWKAIRADPNVKNTYFRDFVHTKGMQDHPHEGRKMLVAEGIKNWERIKGRCPEDVGRLIKRLKA